MESLKVLGKNLRAIREKKHISQKDAELKTGKKQGYISKLENGEINITYKNLAAYCKALDFSPIHVV